MVPDVALNFLSLMLSYPASGFILCCHINIEIRGAEGEAVLDMCRKKAATSETYDASLRRTVLATPKKTVSKMVRAMVPRMGAVVEAKAY